MKSSSRDPAASPVTWNRSGSRATRSRACTPTEPVLPRTATLIFAGMSTLLPGTVHRISSHPVKEVIVKDRPAKEKAVAAIQDPAVPRHEGGAVLDARSALPHRLHQIAQDSGDRQQHSENPAILPPQLGEE